MPHKILPLGPWRRDINFYGEDFLITAKNVSPMRGGYRGGFLPGPQSEITIGGSATTTDIMHAYSSSLYIYGTQYGAVSGGSGTGKILRSTSSKSGGSLPTAYTDITPTTAPKWEGDTLGNIAQYGKYVVFGSLNDKVQWYDEVAGTGVTSDLCSTTPPTGSAFSTATFNARFVAPYKEHMVCAHIKMAADYPSIATTGLGAAFTNQPANDGIEIVSSSASDTTQVITIIGNTNGTDTIVTEDVTLTGTSQASTVKTDWGQIVAVKKSAATVGTITIREASGNATVVTLAPTVLSAGVVSYAVSFLTGALVTLVASGSTTARIGIKGTNTVGAVIYDSKNLNGTNSVSSNSIFATIAEIYVGNLESTLYVTPALGTAANPIYTSGTTYDSLVWISMQDNIRRYASPTIHPEVRASIPINLLDDCGPITGIVGGEELYIFKELAIYKIVGPPFDAVRIGKDIGTISPKSIVEVGGTVFFMSNRGPAMISGGQVAPLAPETFANAMRSGYFNKWMRNKWYSSEATLHFDGGNVIQTEAQLKTMVGTYSDLAGCVVWTSQSGHFFMTMAQDPFNMSYGDTSFTATGANASLTTITAIARSAGTNYYSTSGWLNNYCFGRNGGTGNVKIATESFTGFSPSETTVYTQFTTPMMSLYATEDGPGVCRPIAFRVLGEADGSVLHYAVRTSKTWNDAVVIKGKYGSGNALNSRDGWVQMPNTYFGRFHSLTFTIVVGSYDTGGELPETLMLMPFYSGIDILYEVAPIRSA